MSLVAIHIAVGLLAVTLACFHDTGQAKPSAVQADLAQLWQDPGSVASRDLFYGRGGKALAPSPRTEFAFRALDTTGYSAGFDVVDPQGREWDVKTGEEGQTEVVASRILWAAGYHQPAVYYMPEWILKGGPVATPSAGRFRYGNEHTSTGEWSWTENPFVGSRELQGLVVANLLLNNWDIKPSNNRVYLTGAGATPARWFVVQDIGASLGKTGWPVGNRNDIDDFESQRFVLGVDRGRVQFDYDARHKELLETITPADVVWICRILNRLTDKQWSDAFRAAAYPPDTADRYIRKIKSKIQEGLALESS
jgi:hypothetical protein